MRKRKPTSGIRPWHVGLALAIGAALAVALILAGRPETSPPATTSPTPTFPLEGKAKGYPDATLTIVEYSDFQCPVCATFAREIEPALERDYIAMGKVRLEYRHFAFIGNESVLAAEASECAREQGQFWPYHDLLFASQSGENRGAFAASKLKSLASQLGLERDPFDSCLDSRRYRNLVTLETQSGSQMGVNTTPTFIIDGQGIRGLPSLQDLRRALDLMLTEKAQ